MGLISVVKNLLEGEWLRGLEQTQEEAFIDALTFSMAADHHIDDREQEELTTALEALDWEGTTSLENYVAESTRRAEEAVKTESDSTSFLEDIDRRLGEDWVREETYYIAARIAAADGRFEEAETSYLRRMVDIFQISEKRHREISDQLVRETGI